MFKKIGLFFGSFNPVHNGHLIIANYVRETFNLHQLWFVVSPHNPLKDKSSLLQEYDRKHLIDLAIEGNSFLRTSDIEFKLPQPSYTIDTLTYLKEKFPQLSFVLLMGSDNLKNLHKWKNYETILNNYEIIVYKRSGSEENPFPNHNNIHFLDVPQLDISSTFIRENIKKNISMQYFIPEASWKYIQTYNLYKSKK